MARPLIAVPGRFSASAAALRFAALVNSERLLEAVYDAGGEPLTVLPVPGADVAARLSFADGVLLPGGGDLHPGAYGEEEVHDAVYDVDHLQDEFDLTTADWAIEARRPLLAICRGLQVLNVALGGTLEQHMSEPHRPVVHTVSVDPASRLAAVLGESKTTGSCHHHQRIELLGKGLVASAHAPDGSIEGIEPAEATGFLLGVQWHPEDTFDTDAVQRRLFAAFVESACH